MSKKILIALIAIVAIRLLFFTAFNVKDWRIFFVISITTLGIFLIYKILRKTLLFYPVIIILVLSSSQLFQPVEFSFVNNPVPVWITDEQRREHVINYDNFWIVAMHNKVINYTLSYLEHYFNYFQGDFLFTNGTFLYLFDAFFIGLGLWVIIKSPKCWTVILTWLFAAPLIPAADFQPPTVLKAASMVVPLVIISSFGVLTLLNGIYRRLKGVQ